jgi:hypothetical protein
LFKNRSKILNKSIPPIWMRRSCMPQLMVRFYIISLVRYRLA